MEPLAGVRVLLGVSSSIAAPKALDLASRIRKAGGEVRTVFSAHAKELISPKTFDAITHQRTVVDLWGADHAGEMDHLAATKWATHFVVYPATAHTIAQLAHGLASDALSTFALAWTKTPLLIAPAMNPEMWRHPATQRNTQILREMGHEIIGPASGRMACDDVGPGRLVEPEEFFLLLVSRAQSSHALKGKRVLITAGATREFLDDVRCLTNPSTGLMGLELAREALALGAQVTLVAPFREGELPSDLRQRITLTSIITADDMDSAVMQHQFNADLLVFAAAVSDWRPVQRIPGKPKKEDVGARVTIELERTPDVASRAVERRQPGQLFIGFAAESDRVVEFGAEKLARKGFDLLFANPIADTDAGFRSPSNRGWLLRKGSEPIEVPLQSKRMVARLIFEHAALLLSPEG